MLFWVGMNKQYSDYIIFVDESGSDSSQHVDPLYPVFVLTFWLALRPATPEIAPISESST